MPLLPLCPTPNSILATDPNWRGSTFPWVFLPRRHDRCVTLGWSWGGTLHYALSQVQDSGGPRQKAYWTEQILSSSLFRLYRCIGGDTNYAVSPHNPDRDARRSASHYCVYLILRAIQILGTSLVVPANEPDQLVSALIDADINTASSTPWQVSFPSRFSILAPLPAILEGSAAACIKSFAGRSKRKACIHLPEIITNAPGSPPPVDIFIADRRPTIDASAEIDYGAGSYNPISLEWDPNQSQYDVPPQWQADPTAIIVAGNGEISVVVGNRGTTGATNVEVSVWWHEWPAAPPSPPDWDKTTWTPCAPSGNVTHNINPGELITFDGFAAVPLAPGKRYLLLAGASCGDDLANIDAAPNLPCSQQPTPLLDLVANDNNLGLRVFGQL